MPSGDQWRWQWGPTFPEELGRGRDSRGSKFNIFCSWITVSYELKEDIDINEEYSSSNLGMKWCKPTLTEVATAVKQTGKLKYWTMGRTKGWRGLQGVQVEEDIYKHCSLMWNTSGRCSHPTVESLLPCSSGLLPYFLGKWTLCWGGRDGLYLHSS